MKEEAKQRIRLLGRILFGIYLILLLYVLFFSEGYGRKNWLESDYRYNLELLKEILRFWNYREQLGMKAVLVNLVGNVLAFWPFGFCLPLIWNSTRRLWKTGILGFLMSLFVETMQLIFKVGCFDVDDLLLNTLGAMFGYLMFSLCNGIRRWIL